MIETNKEKSFDTFDVAMATAIKGVALILLLLHHTYRKSDWFSSYEVSLFPFHEWQLLNIVNMGKICVSIFAFITGYGFYNVTAQ